MDYPRGPAGAIVTICGEPVIGRFFVDRWEIFVKATRIWRLWPGEELEAVNHSPLYETRPRALSTSATPRTQP